MADELKGEKKPVQKAGGGEGEKLSHEKVSSGEGQQGSEPAGNDDVLKFVSGQISSGADAAGEFVHEQIPGAAAAAAKVQEMPKVGRQRQDRGRRRRH